MPVITTVCNTCGGPAYLDERTPERLRMWADCWACALAKIKPIEKGTRR